MTNPAEDYLMLRETFRIQKTMVLRLPWRYRLAVMMRFGLYGERDHSLREIGDCVGVSPERARQMVWRGIYELRRMRARLAIASPYRWNNTEGLQSRQGFI